MKPLKSFDETIGKTIEMIVDADFYKVIVFTDESYLPMFADEFCGNYGVESGLDCTADVDLIVSCIEEDKMLKDAE